VRRRNVILLIGLGAVVFVAISGLLARAFSVSGAEDAVITDLVRAEAGGRAGQIVATISGCRNEAACRSRVAQNVAALRRPGGVQIIQITHSAGFSLGGTVGTARVAWLVGSSKPIVQCLRVRHAGDVLQGFQVEVLKLSPRIRSDADCPARF
jgi:hypothetical protein